MKKETSNIINIIMQKMAVKAKQETMEALGDRSAYIGSSDISNCLLKVVLSKLNKEENHDFETLVRFKRGHMSESIISDAYKDISKLFPRYTLLEQHEIVHPDDGRFRAHPDFIIYREDFTEAKFIECKSTSCMPDDAYESWVCQLNWQMNLARRSIFQKYPKIKISGSIIAIDLNTGEVAEFGDYYPNDILFNSSLLRGMTIMKAVEQKNHGNIKPEPSPLCSYCGYIGVCPVFQNAALEITDHDVIKMLQEYHDIKRQLDIYRKNAESIKDDLIRLFGNKNIKTVGGGDYLLKISNRKGRTSKYFDIDEFKSFIANVYPEMELELETFFKEKIGSSYSTLEVIKRQNTALKAA